MRKYLLSCGVINVKEAVMGAPRTPGERMEKCDADF